MGTTHKETPNFFFKNKADLGQQGAQGTQGREANGSAILYTSPTCRYCDAVKALLDQHGVPYVEVDISQNPVAAQELVEAAGRLAVPAVRLNGDIVVGFDQRRLLKLIGAL